MLNREYLNVALATIERDEVGPCLRGPYSALWCASIFARGDGGPPSRDVRPALQRAYGDLWAALTVMMRVEWQRQARRDGHLDEMRWMYFVAADLRELHVALRAFYDALLLLVRPLLEKPGQVPLTSFRKLLQWLDDPQNWRRFDAEIGRELLAARWFWDLRSVRDGLVHHGFQTLVFPDLDQVGFQVHDLDFNSLTHDGAMTSENVVGFERYSAIQVGQAIGLFQRLCAIALARFSKSDTPANLRAHHPGFGLLQSWAGPLAAEP